MKRTIVRSSEPWPRRTRELRAGTISARFAQGELCVIWGAEICVSSRGFRVCILIFGCSALPGMPARRPRPGLRLDYRKRGRCHRAPSFEDATITVKSQETGATRTVTTDDAGNYRVLSLPLGPQELKAEKQGFKSVVRTGISLEVGQEAVVNFRLELGELVQQLSRFRRGARRQCHDRIGLGNGRRTPDQGIAAERPQL